MGMPEGYKKGIELSNRSGKVDFKKLKENGYECILLRHSYRKTIDTAFELYYDQAKENEFEISTYHELYGINEYYIEDETKFYNEEMNKLELDFPCGFIYNDNALNNARNKIDYLNDENILHFKLNMLSSTVKNFNKDKMYYFTYEQTQLPVFELVKELLPLWYYRNTKLYDKTECKIWQKRVNNEVEGIQNVAGIFYKF